MTDAQLLIVTKNHRALLAQAIEEIKQLLPDEAKATYRPHKPGIYAAHFSITCTVENNPDHYQEQEAAYFPALAPLEVLLESLDEDIELLKKSIAKAKDAA